MDCVVVVVVVAVVAVVVVGAVLYTDHKQMIQSPCSLLNCVRRAALCSMEKVLARLLSPSSSLETTTVLPAVAGNTLHKKLRQDVVVGVAIDVRKILGKAS